MTFIRHTKQQGCYVLVPGSASRPENLFSAWPQLQCLVLKTLRTWPCTKRLRGLIYFASFITNNAPVCNFLIAATCYNVLVNVVNWAPRQRQCSPNAVSL